MALFLEPTIRMRSGLAFLSLHGALFPEWKVGFTGFTAPARSDFFAVPFLFLSHFAGVVSFVLRVFKPFADAG